MFTGIVETLGEITSVQSEGTNRIFGITATLDEALKVDQSIAHNGVCLTVTELYENNETGEKHYSVTAIDETLKKTNLGDLAKGDPVNIERCLKAGQRLDGHFVQGHVDTTGVVTSVKDEGGSWVFTFRFPESYSGLIVEKGSICVNGVSLTVVECGTGTFSVAIIPFTYEHTNFKALSPGDKVNLEFDILGKYIRKMYKQD